MARTAGYGWFNRLRYDLSSKWSMGEGILGCNWREASQDMFMTELETVAIAGFAAWCSWLSMKTNRAKPRSGRPFPTHKEVVA